MNKREKAIIVASFDGISSFYCGVGRVVNDFFLAYENLWDSDKPDLFAIMPSLSKNSGNYKPDLEKLVAAICKSNNGRLDYLPMLSNGRDSNAIFLGDDFDSIISKEEYTNRDQLLQWYSCSISAASYINAIAEQYESVYVLAHDIPFAMTARYLKENVSSIWFPHLLGHQSDIEPFVIYEDKSLEYIKVRNRSFVAAISNEYYHLLVEKYYVPEDKIIKFYNGIFKKGYVTDSSLENQVVTKYPELEGKELIFLWGRCSPQKGIDLLLDAYLELLSHNLPTKYHLMLVIPTETGGGYYQSEIAPRISRCGNRVTVLTSFDNDLPVAIVKNPATKVVAFPSRFEARSIAIMEAVQFRNKGTKIVYAPVESSIEILNGVQNTVMCENYSVNSVRKALEQALGTDEISGLETMIAGDFSENYRNGMKHFLMSN